MTKPNHPEVKSAGSRTVGRTLKGGEGNSARQKSHASPKSKWLRSDTGTFALHWVMAIAMITSMVTGFRISWDADGAVFSRWIAPILPQGEIWTPHFIAAIVMFACASAYAIYLSRAALFSRNALGRLRILTMPAPAKLRWQAANIGLHWVFFVLTLAMMGTGILLYLGWGGLVVDIHAAIAITLVAYIFLHVIGHFMAGGWVQLFRIFLPAKLIEGDAVKSRPLLVATLIGITTASALAALDFGSRDTLLVGKVTEAPKLDGVLDDAAWRKANVVRIRTQQGFNLAGGKGESLVEVRGVHDGANIYMAFRWQDPSRSLKRLPLIKREDGWHMLHNRADTADESAFYEDKFAVLFSRSNEFGGGGATHLGHKPLSDQPGALNGRGLHYTTDGSIHDMWQWKASRGGHLGYVDDMYIGPPIPAKDSDIAGKTRYSAGYTNDPGTGFYIYNYVGEPPGGYRGTVKIVRLPKDHAATTAKLGKVALKPGVNDDENAQWWMFEDETVPYSKELDATIPVGTVIPGVLIMGKYSGDRADVAGSAKWTEGWWVLETSRKLTASSKYDVDFTQKIPLYSWVAVYDHNQTRHTRHVRPFKIELQ